MTYIPTKEELEELGFKKVGDSYFIQKDEETSSIVLCEGNYYVFPKSLDDIRTLIRLLTPQ